MIGAGRHEVRVVSHALTKSGQKGTPCVAVTFEDDVGQRITWFGYLTDAALEWTLKALAAMGWDSNASDGRIDSLNGTDLLAGNRVEIVVEEEEYEGKLRPKVRWVNEIGGGVGDRMAPDEATAFATDLRKRILSMRGPAPTTRPGAGGAPRRTAAAPANGGTAQAVKDYMDRRRAPAPQPAPLPTDPLVDDGFNLDDVPF